MFGAMSASALIACNACDRSLVRAAAAAAAANCCAPEVRKVSDGASKMSNDSTIRLLKCVTLREATCRLSSDRTRARTSADEIHQISFALDKLAEVVRTCDCDSELGYI